MASTVYIFGQMAVKSYEDYFTQYGSPFLPILEKFQGTLLAATKNGRTLEGEPFGNWTVLMQEEGLKLVNSIIDKWKENTSSW